LASYSQIAVDQVSLYFSNEEVAQEGKEALTSLKPQIRNKDGLFLDNVEGWQQVCQVYIAQGGEKHFVVGNFNNYESTNYVVVDKTVVNLRNKAYAYYYFDDFIIQPLEDCNDCPCVKKDFEVALSDTFYTGGFNPLTGKIDKRPNDGRISLSILGGTPPYNVNWSNGANGESLKNLNAGTYTYHANDQFNCRATGTVTFVQPFVKEDEFIDDFSNLEVGAALILENIFFEFNKTDLLPESFSELDKVVNIIKQNSIKLLEISGHTDSEGSESYNKKLSEGRAKSVVAYLTQKGIGPETIMAVGYGESRPVDTNTTENGMANNRRVEFKVLKK
jgi:outer membrane protein OmpA-like peptidoglycan-associated protein